MMETPNISLSSYTHMFTTYSSLSKYMQKAYSCTQRERGGIEKLNASIKNLVMFRWEFEKIQCVS